jgi:Asp-tRNA(Asn)/Glu-tRNA(Gln) amidotransferase A subunit family amidase
VGVIGKNAQDIAALFGIISGRDERDATSVGTNPIDL